MRGAMVNVRSDVNHKYYGYEVSGSTILTYVALLSEVLSSNSALLSLFFSGKVEVPTNAAPLYDKINEFNRWAYAAPGTMPNTAAQEEDAPRNTTAESFSGDVSV